MKIRIIATYFIPSWSNDTAGYFDRYNISQFCKERYTKLQQILNTHVPNRIVKSQMDIHQFTNPLTYTFFPPKPWKNWYTQ